MKQLPKMSIALLLSAVILFPSILAVLYYTPPLEKNSYILFGFAEDNEEINQHSEWTAYTDDNGKRTKLAPSGDEGFTGLSYGGQTFYYTRKLPEEYLDNPVLQIGAVNRAVSVFLDDELVYTDCPGLEQRIGSLTLPMLEYDRTKPISVSLPPDCQGKMLTIAQSTPADSEKQTDNGTVWPCEITLYCGYAYESTLISAASRTMLPVALLFALELSLLMAFIWNASAGGLFLKLPVFALSILFQICGLLAKADFFYYYFGVPSLDYSNLFYFLSVAALLLFLSLYATRLRPLFAAATAVQWISIFLFWVTQTGRLLDYGSLYMFLVNLPQLTGFLALAAVPTGTFFLWRSGNRFFRHLGQAALCLLAGYGLLLVGSLVFSPDYAVSVFERLASEFLSLSPFFSLQLLWYLCLISSLAATVLELVEHAAERRTDLAVLSAKNALAIESYEHLRQQSEEVMMLHHDTMKHYSLLRAMAQEAPEQIGSYLDELIQQTESVRPVIASANQTLNILLNGKLNAAAAKGISTEIERCDAPEKLPLSEPGLCSLIVNILDNAIAGASAAADPRIVLDFHCKERHFIFSCENSMSDKDAADKKTPIPGHGYGLKIIRQVMSSFGDNMVSVEQAQTAYKITFILPF